MAWAAPLAVGNRGRILTRGLRVHVDLFESVARADAPTPGHLPIGGYFEPVRFPVQQIIESQWKDQVQGRRRRGQIRRTRLIGLKVFIIVVIERL